MSVATDTRGDTRSTVLELFVTLLVFARRWLAQLPERIERGYRKVLARCGRDYMAVQRHGLKRVAVQRAGQDRDVVGVMLLVVIAATIGYVGLTVMSSTEDTTSFSSGSAFSNSSDSLTRAIETTFGLVEVVFIAIMLALIIGALLFLRGRR